MKELEKLKEALHEQGWVWEPKKKGFMLRGPKQQGCGQVMVHRTPSDVNAIHSIIRDLKANGFIWPWPPRRTERSN